jgi:SAM-dependent methyltransferase
MNQPQRNTAAYYDAFYRESDFPRYSPAVTRRVLLSLCGKIGMSPGASVLDVGCATGYYSAIFASLGYDVTGVDISATAIEKARELHPKLRFLRKDALRREEQDPRFDLVFAFGFSPANTPDTELLRETLRKLAAHLRPGGTLAFLGGSRLTGDITPSSDWYHHRWNEILEFAPPALRVAGGPWLTHFRLMHLLPTAFSMSVPITCALRLLPLSFERRIVLLLRPTPSA